MRLMIWLVLAALAVAAGPGWGVELRAADSIDYPSGKSVSGDLMVAGRQVTVRAGVDGDLTAAGNTVMVAGDTESSVMLGGSAVSVTGRVGNDAWVAGQTVVLDSSVADNAYVAGSNVQVGAKSAVGSDLLAAAGTAILMGKVGRNVRVAAANVVIGGTIDGDVYVRAGEQLRITDGAVIKGDLFYESPRPAIVAKGAKILGEVKHSIPAQEKVKPVFWPRLASSLISTIGLILFGWVAIVLFADRIRVSAETARSSFWLSTGTGLLALLVTPVACVVALITVVGIPLSLVTLAAYAVLVYASRVVAGLALGHAILSRRAAPPGSPVASMALGVAVLAAIGFVPVVGPVVAFLATILGLGAFLVSCWRSARAPAASQ